VQRVIGLDLATQLRDAGLAWQPALHDRFAIPGHDLDDRVFALNDMSTEIRQFGGEAAITFNGAVEWSLDWIMRDDVVWLPSETQLRTALGSAFVGLVRDESGFRCQADPGSGLLEFNGANASDAYGRALLALLSEQPNTPSDGAQSTA
jgi:hypothetical protein